MTGLQAELEAAFRKLPIVPPDDGKIPYEWLIPGIGRQLALMKPVDRVVASRDAAKRKLVALKKHAKMLCEDMSAMALPGGQDFFEPRRGRVLPGQDRLTYGESPECLLAHSDRGGPL